MRINASWVLGATLATALWQPYPRESSGQILPVRYRNLHVPRSWPADSIVILHFDAMRPFGSYKNRRSGGALAKIYADREATEWDVRLDVSSLLPAERIVENARANKSAWCYCLVGGVEEPDVATAPSEGFKSMSGALSSELHVHVAIILCRPARRADVLQLLRGPRKLGDEYCVPRNSKFTYAGWVAHHAKTEFKLNKNDKTILFEEGDLPMDAFNEATCWAVVKMIKKFPSPGMMERFKVYSERLDAIRNEIKIDKEESNEQRKIDKLERELLSLREHMQTFAERRMMSKEDLDALDGLPPTSSV